MVQPRLDELFDQAVELPEAQRAVWLAAACGDDLALRAKLETLLHADARAGDFLATPPDLVAAAQAEEGYDAAPETFGPYHVVRRLGAGGMAEVWLAERRDGEFDQRVAIKQVAYPTPGLLQRFRHERQILAQLEHPHIARLLDGGADTRGVPYLVMEYVEGEPITVWCSVHKASIEQRLNLLRQVMDAVEYAHARLIVHRDLKPGNVLVDTNGRVKLLDFGIAKLLGSDGNAHAAGTLTIDGGRLITPGYSAPEQTTGGNITTRVDVYALAVMAFELLCGKRPFEPPTLVTHAHDAAHTVAPLCSTRADSDFAQTVGGSGSIEDLRRCLRGDLDAILAKALEADPDARYASVEAFAADIDRYRRHEPIVARRGGRLAVAAKFVRRHRLGVSMSAALSIAILAGVAAVLWQARKTLEQAQRAEAVRQFLVGAFENADPSENKGQPITAHQLLEKGEAQLAGLPPSDPTLIADLSGLIGDLYGSFGDYARAKPLLMRAIEVSDNPGVPAELKLRNLRMLAEKETSLFEYDNAITHARSVLALADTSKSTDVVDARRALALALVGKGKLDEAQGLARSVLADDNLLHGERSKQVAEDLILLGLARDEVSQGSDAIADWRHAIDIRRALRGEKDPRIAYAYALIGNVLSHRGDLAGAEEAQRSAYRINEEVRGAEHYMTLGVLSNLLQYVEQQGRIAEALPQRERIVAIARKNSDSRPGDLGLQLDLLAGELDGLGRLQEAENAFRESLAVWARVQGNNQGVRSVDSTIGLGETLVKQGRYDEAAKLLRQALDITEAHPTRTTTRVLQRIHGDLGNLARLEHHSSEAIAEIQPAVDALDRPGNEKAPNLIVLLAMLSEAQLENGDTGQGAATGERALTLARSMLPSTAPRRAMAAFALARAKLGMHMPDQAEPLLRGALAARTALLPANDLRILEVNVELARALTALGARDPAKAREARELATAAEAALHASASPYAADLLKRLAMPN